MGLRDKLYALTYDRLMASIEAAGLAGVRSQLLSKARCDVLEIGAGTGGNLGHYGASVRTLTLTDPDLSMFRRLERAARDTVRPTTVRRAAAEDLPFDDATFDTVVSTLVLCGVDDPSRAVGEIRRVLRADGRLLFVEHVRSGVEELALRQDRMNWLNRALSGCDCTTDPRPRRCSGVGS